MGNNIFTTLMEIGAFILIILIILALIAPTLIAFITPTISFIIPFFIIGIAFLVLFAMYIIQGMINKMDKEL